MAARKQPKHILELTKEEKKKFLNSFDIVLSDCDGVLWNVFSPFENIGEAVNLLTKNDKNFVYVSNNSVRSMKSYKDKIKAAGMEFDENKIIHPAIAIVKYLQKINFEGLIYVIGSSVLKSYLNKAGYEFIEGPDNPIEEDFLELIKVLHDKQPVKAVIIDVDINFSYPKFVRAELYLQNPECIFLQGATDNVLAITNTFHIAGPGPFITGLERIVNQKVIKLGKPGKDLGDIIVHVYSIKDRQRALFVGDTLKQDIKFGYENSFQTLLVLTGGTNKEELFKQTEEDLIPDFYADSFTDFTTFFHSLNPTINSNL